MLRYFTLSFLKKAWEIKNNKFQMILSLISNISIVIIIYYGALNKNLDNAGNNIIMLIYYYTVIYTIISSLVFVSNTIIIDCRTGFIEKVIVSPYGLKSTVVFRVLSQTMQLIIYISLVIGVLFIVSATSIYSISMIFSYYLVLLIGVFSLYGIGLILASISLISKEVYSLTMVLRLILFYLIIQLPTNIIIPFSHANELLYNIIIFQLNISSFKLSQIFGLFINSLIYFLIGLYCFDIFEKNALKTGKYIGF